jgi:hypothetical protein
MLTVWPTATGDTNFSGAADGEDIQGFINALFGGDTNVRRRCAADLDGDGDVDGNDIDPFVDLLLGT